VKIEEKNMCYSLLTIRFQQSKSEFLDNKNHRKRMFSNVGDQSATIYDLKYCKKEKERKKNSNQEITKENDFILTS